MKNKVEKALTPEEQTLVANIKSLLAELEGMQVADQEVQMAGGPAPMQEKPMKQNPGMAEEIVEEEYDETVERAIEHADADGQTANDDAEDRLEDLPDTDEANIKEVAKMLARIMTGQKAVSKNRAPSKDTMVVQAITQMAKVVKSLQAQSATQQEILAQFLEGFGVAKSVTNKKVTKSNPVQSMDFETMSQVFKAMWEANQNKAEVVETPNAGRSEVHKSMGTLIEALGASGPWNL